MNTKTKKLIKMCVGKPELSLVFAVYISVICCAFNFFSGYFKEPEWHTSYLVINTWQFSLLCVSLYLIPVVLYLLLQLKNNPWKGYHIIALAFIVVTSCLMVYLYYRLVGFTRETSSYEAECKCGYYTAMYTDADGNNFCGEPRPFICYKLIVLISSLPIIIQAFFDYVRNTKPKLIDNGGRNTKQLLFFFLAYLLSCCIFPANYISSVFISVIVINQAISMIWRKSFNAFFWIFNVPCILCMLPLLFLEPFDSSLSKKGGGPVTGYFVIGLFYFIILSIMVIVNILSLISHLLVKSANRSNVHEKNE